MGLGLGLHVTHGPLWQLLLSLGVRREGQPAAATWLQLPLAGRVLALWPQPVHPAGRCVGGGKCVAQEVPGTLAFGRAGVCPSWVGRRDSRQVGSRAAPLAPHEALPSADVDSCPQSQTFLYNLTTCQQTCRSLSESDTHCLTGFVPVDGCGCPDHTFLDEKSRCVPLAQCSCYHRGLYLEAGEVVLRQEERWWVSGWGGGHRVGMDGSAWGSPQLCPAPPSHGACTPRQPPLTCLSLAAFARTGGCSACRSSYSARVSGCCPGHGPSPRPSCS